MVKIKNLKFILTAALIILIFLPGLVKLHKLNSKNRDLEDQIIKLQRSNAEFASEVRRLKEDTDYVEKVARQKMGLTKKEEIIYKIREEGKTKSSDE